MNTRTSVLVSLLLPILIAFVPGCATIEDLKSVRQEMNTSIEELKKELEAAKQANQQQTQQVAEESKKGLDLLREAVKTNYETGIGETQKQVRVLSEDVQQLKERQERLLQGLNTMQDSVGKLSGALQQAQQELEKSRKQRAALLEEFRNLRSSVQLTYGGVLDFLRVEEALLKSSLKRVQTILRGTDGTEPLPMPSPETAGTTPTPPDQPSQSSSSTSPADAQETSESTHE